MGYWVTVDSFGSDLPDNWEEIADELNQIIAEKGIEDDLDAVNELWNEYWENQFDEILEEEET